jgi:hypothetical protein
MGYHSRLYDPAFGPIYYAVIPHPVGNFDLRGFNAFQQQTMASSHELAEAATDPDCQTGWQDSGTLVSSGHGSRALALMDHSNIARAAE